jgi:4-diphosphocytidyl-2-C-methyl-D-erythritol kinase
MSRQIFAVSSDPGISSKPMAGTERLAPAKVNLFLHVGAPTADGFHPVCSLMAFADMGDHVTLVPGESGFRLEGPFASGLAKEADNLVTRARDAVLAAAAARANFGLILHKALPVASGLGGGSSDAAATLRLVRDHLGAKMDDDRLRDIAAGLGSDTPACVDPRPVLATGRGERLAPCPAFPDLPIVLVNPGVVSPTGPVYRAYDGQVSPLGANAPDWPERLTGPSDVAAFLRTCRNDLEAPAVALQPAIAETLAEIAAAPQALLTRMSGSGATCFALCEDSRAAASLAARLTAARPKWWVRAGVLGGA